MHAVGQSHLLQRHADLAAVRGVPGIAFDGHSRHSPCGARRAGGTIGQVARCRKPLASPSRLVAATRRFTGWRNICLPRLQITLARSANSHGAPYEQHHRRHHAAAAGGPILGTLGPARAWPRLHDGDLEPAICLDAVHQTAGGALGASPADAAGDVLLADRAADLLLAVPGLRWSTVSGRGC